MAAVKPGDNFPEFEITTINKGRTKLSDIISNSGKTAVVFLRYYGCPLCQYDIINYQKGYDEITRGGNSLIVILQSTPESIRNQNSGEFPFEIICDPEMLIYKALEVNPAKPQSSGKFVPTPKMEKIFKEIEEMGIVHGPNEGIEEQLPAYFILDSDMNVQLSHYSKDPFDVPGVSDLVKLFA